MPYKPRYLIGLIALVFSFNAYAVKFDITASGDSTTQVTCSNQWLEFEVHGTRGAAIIQVHYYDTETTTWLLVPSSSNKTTIDSNDTLPVGGLVKKMAESVSYRWNTAGASGTDVDAYMKCVNPINT